MKTPSGDGERICIPQDMAERSEIDTGADLIAGDHVVTLSTCTDSSSERIVLQGKQIWRKDRDEN